jgi:hypothetical protein
MFIFDKIYSLVTLMNEWKAVETGLFAITGQEVC